MSTEIIRIRPLWTRLGETSLNWIRPIAEKLRSRLLSHRKHLALGAAAVFAVTLSALYFWGGRASAAQYLTGRVERGNLRNTVTATGTLQAVTTVQVGSQASGTISGLYADFNSRVKKDQVIAQLDPAVSKAQVDQAPHCKRLKPVWPKRVLPSRTCAPASATRRRRLRLLPRRHRTMRPEWTQRAPTSPC